MAWKARITRVPNDAPIHEAFDVDVEFYDAETGRSHRKTLNVYAGNINSRADFKAITDAHLLRLRQLDQVRSVLAGLEGQDL